MFARPRCRQFEPLLTTQLRLRNLVKITGHNFQCEDNKCSKYHYYTLHLSAFSKPFYTSEKLDCRNKVDWREINCPQIHTSGDQKFICIRVWSRDNKESDKLLALWGVYFSGLVPTCNQDKNNYKKNTLLFHLYDETFTSPDQLTKNSNFSMDGTPLDNDSSKNQSNGSMKTDESKFHKLRYVCLDFPKYEVQPSYTVEMLLRLQEVQRRNKAKQESSQMLADRICTKSAECLNLELILSKPMFYEQQKQPGMGRTLSLLLSEEKAPLKPEMILKVHELRLKVECARFRNKLLSLQRDKNLQVKQKLEMKRERLKDENIETETMIWNSFRELARTRENLKIPQEKLNQQRENIFSVNQALVKTRDCLLNELNEIYHIKKNDAGAFTINNIHLPDAECYATASTTPTEISIALGYVSHAVLIVAKILNIPLRNPIKHEGSRSKIYDNIKILPPSDRIFPLFCRTMPPPNVLLYGVYLLNQNISQLKHVLGMNKGDLRATLANLWDLLKSSGFLDLPRNQLIDNTIISHVEHSTSSVDSVPLDITIPSSLRVSRSLDDFTDLIVNLQSKFNISAPNIKQQKL